MESISKYIEESLSGNTEYLTEAVASRKTGKYIQFPDEPDKDKIVKFLEEKGFENVSQTSMSNGKYYRFGDENPKKPETFWIKFGDAHIRPFREFFCRYDNLNHATWSDFMVNAMTIFRFDVFRELVCEYFGWE